MASRKNKVKYIRGQKVPSANTIQNPSMIGSAMSAGGPVLNSADMVNPSTLPTANSLGSSAVPSAIQIQPSALLGTDSVMGMQSALEMANPNDVEAGVSLGQTTATQNGVTRRSKVRKKR